MGSRILCLYTELADYTIACFKALKSVEAEAEILVIHYPINPEAPFLFDFEGIGEFKSIVELSKYQDLDNYVRAFQPQKIVCSGWSDKRYVRICNKYKRTAKCVLVMDNHWKGSLKQHVLRLFSRLFLIRIFKKVWVPGTPQVQYAKKLGFANADIITRFYCCDVKYFDSRFRKYSREKFEHFPRRFLCVARYTPQKGYPQLWDAFIEWKNRYSNDWELWCAGTGEGYSTRISHPSIRHLGFVQKDQWEDVIANTSAFVLASTFEPWGVAVQEFASSGYPLLLSKYVGASSAFLTSENGLVFDPLDKEDMIKKFHLMAELITEDFKKMSQASNERAFVITPEIWAHDLLDM